MDGAHAADFAGSGHNHDSAYAPLAKGVTNGDSHDHNGGDGAAIAEGALALADVTTGDVSATKHGFCPKAPNDTTKFLRGDGAWAAPAGGSGIGFCLQVGALNLATVGDGATLYVGGYPGAAPQTVQNYCRVYIPKACTLKAAYIWFSIGTPATPDMGEYVNVYFRKISTDTLIQTVEFSSDQVLASNTSLNVSCSAGDQFVIKIVTPTFSYNPANMKVMGTLYFE